jgi:HSP20 family protein
MARGPFFSNRPIGGGSSIFGVDPLATVQREVNRVFDEVWRNLPGGEERASGVRSFSIDLSETPTQIRVRAELPGVAEPDVDVTLDDDRLTIHAERRTEARREGETAHAAEIAPCVYQRTIRLPAAVDPDEVDARFDRGVLVVTLDKPRAPERGRKIPVRAGARSTGATQGADDSAMAGLGIDTSQLSKATPSSEAYIQGDGALGASPSTGAGDSPAEENATKPGGAVHGYNE